MFASTMEYRRTCLMWEKNRCLRQDCNMLHGYQCINDGKCTDFNCKDYHFFQKAFAIKDSHGLRNTRSSPRRGSHNHSPRRGPHNYSPRRGPHNYSPRRSPLRCSPRRSSRSPYRKSPRRSSRSPYRKSPRRSSRSPYRKSPRRSSPSPYRKSPRRSSRSPYRKSPRRSSRSPYRKSPRRSSRSPYRRNPRRSSQSPYHNSSWRSSQSPFDDRSPKRNSPLRKRCSGSPDRNVIRSPQVIDLVPAPDVKFVGEQIIENKNKPVMDIVDNKSDMDLLSYILNKKSAEDMDNKTFPVKENVRAHSPSGNSFGPASNFDYFSHEIRTADTNTAQKGISKGFSEIKLKSSTIIARSKDKDTSEQSSDSFGYPGVNISKSDNLSPTSKALQIIQSLPKDFFDINFKTTSNESVRKTTSNSANLSVSQISNTYSSTNNNSSNSFRDNFSKPITVTQSHPPKNDNIQTISSLINDNLWQEASSSLSYQNVPPPPPSISFPPPVKGHLWTPQLDRNKKQAPLPPQPPKISDMSAWEIETPYITRNNRESPKKIPVLEDQVISSPKMKSEPSLKIESKTSATSTLDNPPSTMGKSSNMSQKLDTESVPVERKKKRKRSYSSSSSSSSSSEDEKDLKIKLSSSSKEQVKKLLPSNKEHLLEKKKNILTRVWKLMEQKKKLDTQREVIPSTHKGDLRMLKNVLAENSALSSEIQKQIYNMNKMVKELNSSLGINEFDGQKEEFFLFSTIMDQSSNVMPKMLAVEGNNTEMLKKEAIPEKFSLNKSPPEKLSLNRSPSRSVPKGKLNSEKKNDKKEDTKRTGMVEFKKEKYKKEKNDGFSLKKDNLRKDTKLTTNEEYAPSISSKPCIKYIDQGFHWCALCNDFLDSVGDYIKHLESIQHLKRLKNDTKEWLPKPPKVEKEVRDPKSPVVTIPLQGLEFMHSVTTFYCSLCSKYISSEHEAQLHCESNLHVSKYKDRMVKEPLYEMVYNKNKMSAFAKFSVAREKTKTEDSIETVIAVEPPKPKVHEKKESRQNSKELVAPNVWALEAFKNANPAVSSIRVVSRDSNTGTENARNLKGESTENEDVKFKKVNKKRNLSEEIKKKLDEDRNDDTSKMESKDGKTTSKVMIGKMPFLKRTNKNKKSFSEKLLSDMRSRKEEIIEKKSERNVKEQIIEKKSESNIILPMNVPKNTEYITEIEFKGNETKFTKVIGPTFNNPEQDLVVEDMDIDSADSRSPPVNTDFKKKTELSNVTSVSLSKSDDVSSTVSLSKTSDVSSIPIPTITTSYPQTSLSYPSVQQSNIHSSQSNHYMDNSQSNHYMDNSQSNHYMDNSQSNHYMDNSQSNYYMGNSHSHYMGNSQSNHYMQGYMPPMPPPDPYMNQYPYPPYQPPMGVNYNTPHSYYPPSTMNSFSNSRSTDLQNTSSSRKSKLPPVPGLEENGNKKNQPSKTPELLGNLIKMSKNSKNKTSDTALKLSTKKSEQSDCNEGSNSNLTVLHDPSKASETDPSKFSETNPSKVSETDPSKVSESDAPKVFESDTSKASETDISKSSETDASKSSETDTSKASETDSSKASETDTSKVSETDTSKIPEADSSKAFETDTSKAFETDTSKAFETDTSKASETDTSKAFETDTSKIPDADFSKVSETDTSKASETDTFKASETGTSKIPEASEVDSPKAPEILSDEDKEDMDEDEILKEGLELLLAEVDEEV